MSYLIIGFTMLLAPVLGVARYHGSTWRELAYCFLGAILVSIWCGLAIYFIVMAKT